MASNRKQPFGYQIVCGEVIPHESEAETVRWIFATYPALGTDRAGHIESQQREVWQCNAAFLFAVIYGIRRMASERRSP